MVIGGMIPARLLAKLMMLPVMAISWRDLRHT
jgi:hypothetical protein